LDRYDSLAAYAEAKRRIFRGAGCMVLNADDLQVAAMAEPGRDVIRFTLDEPGPGDFGLREREGRVWLAHGEEPWLAAEEWPLSGAHNLANALAALAMGKALGLPRTALCAALREFRGLPHRCERVAERAGVRWYDDSKGTNVGAAVAAVQGLPGPLVLIAGGEGKGQDFSALAAALPGKVRALILIGRDAPLIETAVAGAVPCHWAGDMDAAVRRAADLARPGDSVLLSPACASFDMFADYRARGEAFAAAVRGLPAC
ncbi:MAG: UDP-N-acetylmuramoyl-L-alanine--D-glutamate ligase, partial [Candidatus Competibacterales bacterium]|nr:UDP-N-acetylmuramoyl-L-alanine--D-glutamate ligase [Candidatus Competibacterales bacterium]